MSRNSTLGEVRASVAPETMTIPTTMATFGWSRARIYRAAAAGQLNILKNGRQSLIRASEMRALIDALPVAVIGRPAKRVA